MTEDLDELDDPEETDDSNDSDLVKNLRRQIKDATKAARDAEERATRIERAEKFRAAGLDPTSKRDQLFIDGYKGELDVDAIKAEAIELEFLPPDKDDASESEIEQHTQIAQTAAGVTGTGTLSDAEIDAELRKVASTGDKEAFESKLRELRGDAAVA